MYTTLRYYPLVARTRGKPQQVVGGVTVWPDERRVNPQHGLPFILCLAEPLTPPDHYLQPYPNTVPVVGIDSLPSHYRNFVPDSLGHTTDSLIPLVTVNPHPLGQQTCIAAGQRDG